MIESIEIRLINLSLVEHFETSFGRVEGREIILLIFRGDGILAFSECTTDKVPLYSYEDNKTALHIIEDYLIPIILNEGINEPEALNKRVKFIKGHNMAKAAVELGLWDYKAKRLGKSLFEIWGGAKDKVLSGVSIGIKDNIEELIETIQRRIDEGYKRIKLKIKHGKDIKIIEKVREQYSNILLSVDGNCAYNYNDNDIFRELDKYDLMMIEQPFAYNDLYFHSLLQKEIKTDICLDESITDRNRMKEAIELRSGKVVNIKVGRVGGFIEAQIIHDLCEENMIPVWCGGMLEAGVGRAFNIILASLRNFVLPNDISETRRYWEKDIIDYEYRIKDGCIEVPKGIGIGVNLDFKYIEHCTIMKKEYSK